MNALLCYKYLQIVQQLFYVLQKKCYICSERIQPMFMIKILSNNDMNQMGRSSLAGKCAISIYINGCVTISKKAAELMNLDKNNCLQVAEDGNNNIYFIPNKDNGYKVSLRKTKHTYTFQSAPFSRYISLIKNKKLSPGKKILCEVWECDENIDNKKAYLLK